MKNLLFAASLCMLMHYAARGQDTSSYVLSGKNIGELTWIGQNIDTAVQNLSRFFKVTLEKVPICEGCRETATKFVVRDRKGILFTLEPGWTDTTYNRIGEFRTTREEFVTDKGIRVGMTYGDLKKKCRILNVNYSRGIGVNVLVKGFSGSFRLQIPEEAVNEEVFYIRNLPDDIPIREIIMY